MSERKLQLDWLHGAESLLRTNRSSFLHFMDPEGSLPHSQKPITCLYTEPDQSTPFPIPLLKGPFYYYPPMYAWVFLVVSFPQASLPKRRTHLCCLPYVLHAPLVSFFLIWLPEYYLVNCTGHKTKWTGTKIQSCVRPVTKQFDPRLVGNKLIECFPFFKIYSVSYYFQIS